jgi:hypothetical protein
VSAMGRQPWLPPAGASRGELDRLTREAIDRSELAVRVKRLEARADYLETFVALAPVGLASPGAGNVAFTTIDPSASIPAPYRIAVIRVTLGGTRTANGAFATNRVDFRKDAGSQIAATVGMSFANLRTRRRPDRR